MSADVGADKEDGDMMNKNMLYETLAKAMIICVLVAIGTFIIISSCSYKTLIGVFLIMWANNISIKK